jgi:predicted kinase
MRLVTRLTIPATGWRQSVLIALFGLPCSGKTEITQYLASRLPLIALSTDEIRQHLGLPSGPATHAVMYEAASVLLPQKVGIVWDGIHSGRQNRVQMREFASHHDAYLELIYTVASPEVIRRRLDDRIRAPDKTATEGKFVITPEHFARIARYLEPPTPDEGVQVIDTTDGAIEDQIRPTLKRLEELVLEIPVR